MDDLGLPARRPPSAAVRKLEVIRGKHSLVQNATNHDSFGLNRIEDDMVSDFKTLQTRPEELARTPDRRALCDQSKSSFKSVEILGSLAPSPSRKRVLDDIGDILFSFH